MTRARRDREAERVAIRAAADRLLSGTPLRSATGNGLRAHVTARARETAHGQGSEPLTEAE
jgi:hypothetical protein